MKRLVFDSCKSLALEMIGLAENRKTVSAVLFYDEAAELLKYLVECGDCYLVDIEISEPECKGYELEYYVTITEDFEVYVEPGWHDEITLPDGRKLPKGYLSVENDRVFIDGDANSAIIKGMNEADCFEIEFLDDEFDNIDNDDDYISDSELLDVLLENMKVVFDDDKEHLSLAFDVAGAIKDILK